MNRTDTQPHPKCTRTTNNVFLFCPVLDCHPTPSGVNNFSLGGRRFPSGFLQDLCSEAVWGCGQALLGWNPRDVLCVPGQVPSPLWACFPICTTREWARHCPVPSDPWLLSHLGREHRCVTATSMGTGRAGLSAQDSDHKKCAMTAGPQRSLLHRRRRAGSSCLAHPTEPQGDQRRQ